jgi:hypothetical protein
LPEIAAKLKETPMVSGIFRLLISNHFLVRRGRTAALLSGAGSKKRKRNPNEDLDMKDYMTQEIESLKQQLQEAHERILSVGAQNQIAQQLSNPEIMLGGFKI